MYELGEVLSIVEPQNTTIIDKLIFAIIYYGWVLAFTLAFAVIYYGVVVQQLNKRTKGYTKEDIEEHQNYYDTYYEAYKTNRRKKPRPTFSDDEDVES